MPPGLNPHGSGLNRRDTALDLGIPRPLGVRVRWPVQAGQQFR
jgi:hypothetical protein